MSVDPYIWCERRSLSGVTLRGKQEISIPIPGREAPTAGHKVVYSGIASLTTDAFFLLAPLVRSHAYRRLVLPEPFRLVQELRADHQFSPAGTHGTALV